LKTRSGYLSPELPALLYALGSDAEGVGKIRVIKSAFEAYGLNVTLGG